MAGEEGLMKQVEELKRKIREVEKEKEEIRRRKEAMMRESDAGGVASRAIGSVMHVGLQGQEGMHVKLQPQMVVADVIFFSGAGGSAMHVGLQGQEDYHGGPLSEVFGSPESTEVDCHGGPLSEVSGSPEWLQTNNVEMTMFSLSEVPSAAPATGGTVFSAASVGGAPASSAVVAASVESAAEPAISGTVPSAASVRGEVGGRESPAGTASSDAVAKALTGDTDVAYAGALLRPFDPGKRYHRGARMEKAVRGLDLPFDRGKTWRRLQHGG